MSDPIPLIGGVLHDSGAFYLLVDHEDAEDDESVVAAGQAEFGRVLLTQLTDLEEIVSIITLSAAWSGFAEAACLTAEGVVYFLTLSTARSEVIPGAGYAHDGSLGLGRMTTLREVDGWLFAMGYGGQVYRRRINSVWENINLPPEPAAAASLYTAVLGSRSGSFVFGGVNIAEYVETDEIEAATDAGDADRLADLILDAIGVDTLTIRLFNGTWSESELDAYGVTGPIIREGSSSWLVFTSTGVIWRTSDFQSFNEIYSAEVPQGWDDVKVWNERPLVLQGGVLRLLENDTFTDFPDPLPAAGSQCLSIWVSVAGLAAIHREVVLLHDGEAWTQLVPVLPPDRRLP